VVARGLLTTALLYHIQCSLSVARVGQFLWRESDVLCGVCLISLVAWFCVTRFVVAKRVSNKYGGSRSAWKAGKKPTSWWRGFSFYYLLPPRSPPSRDRVWLYLQQALVRSHFGLGW
jgi:hypothetical protein